MPYKVSEPGEAERYARDYAAEHGEESSSNLRQFNSVPDAGESKTPSFNSADQAELTRRVFDFLWDHDEIKACCTEDKLRSLAQNLIAQL